MAAEPVPGQVSALASGINHTTFDCADPERLGRFWAAALGLESHADNEPGDPEWLIYDPSGRSPGLLFIGVPEPKTAKNRVHLDLQPRLAGRDVTVGDLQTHGATVLADHRRPDGSGWVTMADPEGNEFCVERSRSERRTGAHAPAEPASQGRWTHSLHTSDERTMLCGLLDWYREGVISKLSNLDDVRSAQVSGLRTNTTLNGLVKHLAYVEDFWFTERFTGEVGEPWAAAPWESDPDWEFTSARTEDPADVIALYRSACERSRAVASADLDSLSGFNPAGRPAVSVRYALVHLLEETARHLGHLDILREMVDGTVGS